VVVRRAVSENRDRAVLALVSPRVWESWLTKHHATSSGVWLKIVKKNSKMKGPSYEEALDAALCFGWIDGQKDSFDGDYWLQRITPRKPRSKWSRINVEKAVGLTKQGRMKSAGLTQRRRPTADGTPHTNLKAPRPYLMTCGEHSTRTARLERSSNRSTAAIGMRSSIAFKMRRSPRRERDASRRTSRC
jgi:uncharacterized protein YdeI (YjbR/CyaY-like superfamily)